MREVGQGTGQDEIAEAISASQCRYCGSGYMHSHVESGASENGREGSRPVGMLAL